MKHHLTANGIRTQRLIVGGLAFVSCSALADQLGDANDLLCYGLTATICELDGHVCESFEPWELNLPDFVEVDLRNSTISSTEASLEELVTPVTTIVRSEGRIVLQGMEGDKAFSWVMSQDTGEGTMTVSAVHLGVTIFTVCTPR